MVSIVAESRHLSNMRKTLSIETFNHIYISNVEGRKVRIMCMRDGWENDTILSCHPEEYPSLIALLTKHGYEVRPNLARPGVVAEPARNIV